MINKHNKQKIVLQLRSSIGFFGAENVIAELAKQLSNSNYHPIVGVMEDKRSPHIELAEVAERYNLETKKFKCSRQFNLSTALAIRSFIDQRGIDIIHSHGYKANIYSLLAASFKNVKLVATCHPWITNNLPVKLYAWLDKSLLNRFDRIVTISDEIREEILKHNLSESKVSVIDNGIDISRFMNGYNRNDLAKEFDIKPGDIVVGTIGRLSEEKGQKNFIEAAKSLTEKFENLKFLIVGDGPLKQELRAHVSSLKLNNNFIFTGVSENIPKVLALMDIFVLPSLTEGMPMVLLEAMAAKKPVVATTVGAIPRLISDKKSGCLVEPNDPVALKNALEFLLNNKDEREAIAHTGYEIVVQKYSSEEMARKYIDVFNQVYNDIDGLV